MKTTKRKVGVLDRWCTKGERKFWKRETSRLRRRKGKSLDTDPRLKSMIRGYVS